MPTYVKITDFAAKDTLLSGNPAKIIKGSEIGAEFDALTTADASNVKGPSGTSTDNALVRWDGTTGRATQDSAITVADSGATTLAVNSASTALTITQTGAGNALTATGNVAVTGSVSTSGTTAALTMDATNAPYITFKNSGTAKYYIGSWLNLAGSGSGDDMLLLSTGKLGFGAGNAVVGQFDTSGNWLVGTTTAKAKITLQGQLAVGQTGAASSACGIYLYASDTLSDNSYLSRVSNGSGTTTWYIGNQSITTSSDERLKDNIKPTARNATDLLMQWEIIDHTWNDPSDTAVNNRNSRGVWTGIRAQQVQPITPWLVNKPTNEVNEDGSINPWTMDFGYAVPLLVKMNQEQEAKIETLEAKVAQLEADKATLLTVLASVDDRLAALESK
jgi:hypothetical protein